MKHDSQQVNATQTDRDRYLNKTNVSFSIFNIILFDSFIYFSFSSFIWNKNVGKKLLFWDLPSKFIKIIAMFVIFSFIIR